MKTNHIYITLLAIFMLSTSVSCSKFLEVQPSDRVTQKELLKDYRGFYTLLNGIYAELNTNNLYGGNLSMGMIDVMAQYYDAAKQNHPYLPFMTYSYSDAAYLDKSEAIWTKAYSLIANTNLLIEQSDVQRDKLSDTHYHILKGEGLALRAFLHFDLLRLYGSKESSETDQPAIVYNRDTDRETKAFSTNEEVIGFVIQDLTEARNLLSSYDPILTEGPLNFEGDQTNLLNYRQYRLNYIAVCALLARVHLWEADIDLARQYALEVIDKAQAGDEPFFPFVTSSEVNNRVGYPDLIFSKEVLFGLYHSSRVNLFNSLFNNRLTSTQRLTFSGSYTTGRVSLLYPNQNDYRAAHWATQVVDNEERLYFNKYSDVSDSQGVSNAYRYMIPLIRISEMYLILAETAASVAEAVDYLNILNLNRGLPDVTASSFEEIKDFITTEYYKEFIGEGQLFFYFKRLQAPSIASATRPEIDRVVMDPRNYIFPLPLSEISQRN